MPGHLTDLDNTSNRQGPAMLAGVGWMLFGFVLVSTNLSRLFCSLSLVEKTLSQSAVNPKQSTNLLVLQTSNCTFCSVTILHALSLWSFI